MPISTRRKVVLVGEQNPYGSDPHFALYPAPDGCSGHRLCCLVLGMSRKRYLSVFERVNLCDGPWSARLARVRAGELLAHPGRRFVLCGSKVAGAFGVAYEPFLACSESLLVLPHPSGLCRLWSEPGAFVRARSALAEFAPELAQFLGTNRPGGDD